MFAALVALSFGSWAKAAIVAVLELLAGGVAPTARHALYLLDVLAVLVLTLATATLWSRPGRPPCPETWTG